MRKIDAVLPLTLSDIERFRILEKSLEKYFEGLNKCWVITPDREYTWIKRKLNNEKFHVIRETTIIPDPSLNFIV